MNNAEIRQAMKDRDARNDGEELVRLKAENKALRDALEEVTEMLVILQGKLTEGMEEWPTISKCKAALAQQDGGEG